MNTITQPSGFGALFLKFRLFAFVSFGLTLGMCFVYVLFKETVFPNIHPLVLIYSLRSVAVSGFIIFGIDTILMIKKWPQQLNWAGKRIAFIALGLAIFSTAALNEVIWLERVGLVITSLAVLSLVGILPDIKKGS